jgi:hypothetical protein
MESYVGSSQEPLLNGRIEADFTWPHIVGTRKPNLRTQNFNILSSVTYGHLLSLTRRLPVHAVQVFDVSP